MTKEEMTYEEKANTDKLEFYWREKVKVHIILKRKDRFGKNAWMNVIILDRLSNRLWLVKDPVDGELHLSISDIVPWGVEIFKGVHS